MNARLRSTPERTTLHAVHRSANRKAVGWAAVETVAICALAGLLPWSALEHHLPALGILTAYGLGTLLLSLGLVGAQRKHQISSGGHITLGRYQEQALYNMVEEVRSRVGHSTSHLRVFITREKAFNASAIRIGASRLLPWLNGVYIHRSLLHLLQPDELRSVLGHELGHLGPFRSRSRDFLLVHTVFAILTGYGAFTVTRIAFGLGDLLVLLGSLGALSVAATFSGRFSAGPVDEFLCDEFGAQIAGVEASISALFKLGAASEMQLLLQLRALEVAREGGRLDARQALEVYEEVLPFGQPDLESATTELDRALHRQQAAASRLSLRGFLSYLWDDSDEESEADLSEELRRLVQTPRIDTRDLRERAREGVLSGREIETLVERLERSPSQLLFASVGEANEEGSTHPALWRRILYLWRNRGPIEAQSPALVTRPDR